MNQLLSRQADFVPDMSGLSAAIFGVGGLGSNLARTVASLGVQGLILVDPDDVIPENVYPGWFSLEDVGEKKVDAVGDRIERWYDRVKVTRVPDTVENVPMDYLPRIDVGFAVTDNIESRRAIWQRVGESDIHNPGLWFDGRMGGDGITIIAFKTDDEVAVARYNKYEIQKENRPLECGMKATAYITQGMVPGLAGAILSKWQSKQDFPYIFHWEAKNLGDIIRAGAKF